MAKRHEVARERAKELRSNMTPAEQKLWAILRAGQIGVKFQRQVVLAPYMADFAARSARLIIEIDGDTHALSQESDAIRTKILEARGYRVIRFSNSDVMTNIDGVMRAICIAVGREDGESPLSPPSVGGAGLQPTP